MSSVLNLPVLTLQGNPTTLGEITQGRAAMIVNVASKCGLTKQYSILEDMHTQLSDRGFTVIGFPSNQFGGQEPGSAEEIAEFCSTTYGVTFPMSGKIDVNGENRDPIYAELVKTQLDGNDAEEISWNFEKFVLAPDGTVVGRFSPKTSPDDPAVVAAIEKAIGT